MSIEKGRSHKFTLDIKLNSDPHIVTLTLNLPMFQGQLLR